ncbi:TIGR00341 family protein [Patescibacteria group bacterium]|nr:TIGR00341 family protein [Patescibacteria group bacterium]
MFWPFTRNEPSLLEATKKERQEAIESLINQGTLNNGYYLMLLIATLIVTPGLLLNNVAVIIGGMILAPLIIPILSLSLALVSGNVKGMIRSLRILLFSVVITLLTSALLTMVLSQAYNVVSWIPDQITPGIYIFIAFCSGVAGAFALVKKNLAPAIAGVAVTVSLLPPVCAAGIGLALKQYSLTKNSLILLGANFVGMCVAAFIVFWVLGFLDSGQVEEKAIKKTTNEKN